MSFERSLSNHLSSEGSAPSPLRKNTRQSLIAFANTEESPATILNDDDAERRERRRLSLAPDVSDTPPVPTNNSGRRKSVGLGAFTGLSAAQLAEHYANCIKLSTENKINAKNAFSLQLIDYMSMMLKRRDKQMEDFQVASCTLDASTKIYGFRVDAVHSDVVQMATSMGRTEAARKKKFTDDGDGDGEHFEDGHGEDNEEGDPKSGSLKKLKKRSRRHKSSITDKPESLIRKQQVFQPMNPFLVRLSANLAVSQAGECPFHHSLKYREESEYAENSKTGPNEKRLDETQTARGTVPLPHIPDVSDKEICPSFLEFKLVGWKPENDPSPSRDLPTPPPFPNITDDHAFDMNQTPEPIPDFDTGGGACFDDGGDSEAEEMYAGPEAACRAAAKLPRQPAHVVDLQQHLSTVPLEYSYFQQSLLSLWAGPTHWKIKPLRKTDNDAGKACQQGAKKRRKKELVLSFEDNAESQEFFGTAMKKLARKTIQGWSSERVTAPVHLHYDRNMIRRLFVRKSITVHVTDQTAPPEVDEGVGDYAYDNPTDQASFCPNVPADDMDDDNGRDDGPSPDYDDAFPSHDVHCELEAQEQELGAFTGDNLIAPPNKVSRMYIPYQMRAKKMDMKKLKSCMWRILTDTPDSNKENQIDSNLQDEAENQEKSKVERTHNFKELYEILPSKIGPKMAENLSCALTFVGLLHLANEKCLDIAAVEDLSNLFIKQG